MRFLLAGMWRGVTICMHPGCGPCVPLQVGELFNLPLVSECVDWARYVVRRHFALVGGAMGAA